MVMVNDDGQPEWLMMVNPGMLVDDGQFPSNVAAYGFPQEAHRLVVVTNQTLVCKPTCQSYPHLVPAISCINKSFNVHQSMGFLPANELPSHGFILGSWRCQGLVESCFHAEFSGWLPRRCLRKTRYPKSLLQECSCS